MSVRVPDLAPRHITRRAGVRWLAVGGLGLLSACAGPATAPTTAPAGPTTAPAAPTVAATSRSEPPPTAAPKPSPALTPVPKPTQAPVKREIAKIVIAQPTQGMSFAPIVLARGMKFFEDEAIEVDQQVLGGSAMVLTAMNSAEAQVAAFNGNDQLVGFEKGFDLITTAALQASVSSAFVVRPDFLERKGITPQQPLRDRIGALRGAKIGVTTISGAPTQLARYALKLNGLDPEADAEYVVVGSGAPRLTALRQGQVDTIIAASPEPEQLEIDRLGLSLVRLADEMPVFKTFMWQVIGASKAWIAKNTDVTERFCRAIGRACNLIRGDLPAAKAALKPAFSELKPEVVDLTLDRLVTAFWPDARMTEEAWKNTVEVYLFSGAIKSAPSTAEGVLWTNRYLVNVPKR